MVKPTVASTETISRLGRKRRAAVYRLAAKMIEGEEHHFACPAIHGCSPAYPQPAEGLHLIRDYLDMLGKRSGGHYAKGLWGFALDHKARDRRVLSLCFMAAMVESGDA
jgi:hypothetical protein